MLVMSHGVMVEKDAVKAGAFIKSFSIPGSGNSYFDGTWEELEQIVQENFKDNEPGSGSVNGDVLLINIPADRVLSSVIEITDANRHLVVDEEHVRQEGEAPVVRKVIKADMVPARFAQVVVYRADVLEQDSGRSTDAEWEMVALLGKIDEVEPMHPTTMLRNTNHEEGGTYREYTDKEWADAYEYWDNHAYIVN